MSVRSLIQENAEGSRLKGIQTWILTVEATMINKIPIHMDGRSYIYELERGRSYMEGRSDIFKWLTHCRLRLPVTELERGKLEPSSLLSKIWKEIWGTVPKIQIFMWKFLSNVVVVRDNISRRGMNVNLICTLC